MYTHYITEDQVCEVKHLRRVLSEQAESIQFRQEICNDLQAQCTIIMTILTITLSLVLSLLVLVLLRLLLVVLLLMEICNDLQVRRLGSI